MDETISPITEDQFQESLEIQNTDFVYRQVHKSELDKEGSRFPRASHFKIRFDKGEKELSVNWNAYIELNDVLILIGLTQNPRTGIYKEIKNYEVFKFNVGFLRGVNGVEKVAHSPWFVANPAPVGAPNNYAHASVYYPDDEQVRQALSNYANEEYGSCYCPVDIDNLETIVAELRTRLNRTKYHRCSMPTAADQVPEPAI